MTRYLKRLALALVASSLTIASCTTIAPPSLSAIDRAQAAYDRIAVSAELILPLVSPERAERIRLAMALTEQGLLAARNASTTAEKLAALKQAEAATATIEATAGT